MGILFDNDLRMKLKIVFNIEEVPKYDSIEQQKQLLVNSYYNDWLID